MTENNDTEELEELPEVTKRFYEEYDVELFYADKGTSGTFAVLERVIRILQFHILSAQLCNDSVLTESVL